MGYFFTLLYLLTAYVSPPILFGPLSEYHVEIVVVFLAIGFSLPGVPRSGLIRSPQMLAFAGMAFTLMVSFLRMGWLGGAFDAFYGFMQPCFAFFLVAINCRTKRHLQWLVLTILLGSTFFITAGLLDLHNNVIPSEYVFGEEGVRRIRGLGFAHDPNDLAQVLVSLIPAVFLWRQKNFPANVVVLGIPLAVLLTGMYFTHSRGAAMALTAVIVISARRKIGTIPAVVAAGVLLAGTFAIGWSGGRDVSMDAGADRLDLWYGGLDLIKSYPLFGVGLNGFIDRFGITAHNSVIICAAETGMVGLFFWVLLLFSTIRSGVLMGKVGTSSDSKAEEESRTHPSPWQETPALHWTNEQVPALAGEMRISTASVHHEAMAAKASSTLDPVPSGFEVEQEPEEEIRRMVGILVASLTGFLVAGWFLSRAYSIWLFMYCGMMFALLRMGTERGMKPKKDSPGQLLGWTFLIACALIVAVSVILRLRRF